MNKGCSVQIKSYKLDHPCNRNFKYRGATYKMACCTVFGKVRIDPNTKASLFNPKSKKTSEICNIRHQASQNVIYFQSFSSIIHLEPFSYVANFVFSSILTTKVK